MAGDWIKVEQATLDKAEVLRMAEMLGMERRECLGLLLDFWAWLDNNTRAEVVPNLSRLSLDNLVNEPGFAAAMEAVGWIEWDDKNVTARIINYDHHNGVSAKARAYEQKKKKRQRQNASQECPDDAGTREEKRRTNTPIVPDGFAVFWSAYARKVGKHAALGAWKRLDPTDDLQARIVADVQRRAACGEWTRDRLQFVPHPATYLNGRRWEDEAPAMMRPRVVA